jgi:hypothetical protein
LTTPPARQAYADALCHLSAHLGSDWKKTDWDDRALGWRYLCPAHAASPAQGWKIHVSASAAEAPVLLSRLADVLARLRMPFKLPRRVDDIVFLNSGDAGKEQLGKILTVYPRDDEQARTALSRIDCAWPVSQGPEVQTDLHPRPGSAVSFRYGVFHGDAEIVGTTGIHVFALVAPDGSLHADIRDTKARQSAMAPCPPVPGYPPAQHWVRLDAPVRIGQSEYIALAVLGETPRASVFLGADLATLGTAVLKAGRRGAAGDASGCDIRALLRAEFETLQALGAWPGVAPRALQWTDGQWPALAMQDLRGERLSDLPRALHIACLPRLADALARVHEAGFVHGDVKPDNALRHEGGVALIDFELAAHLGQAMRSGGTRGHLAPEVRSGASVAHPARDVFALAGCVVHAMLETPPALLPGGPERLTALLRNEGLADVARCLAPSLAPDPACRPGARELGAALHARVDQWRAVEPDPGSPSTDAELRWYRRAACDAACAASAFMQPRKNGACWRNAHFMRLFDCEAVNIGAAGIMLGLLSIDCAFERADHCAAVGQAARWLAERAAAGNAAGLFTGNAGVAIALAVTGSRLGQPACLEAARLRLRSAIGDRRELDLFSGSAGVVWSACLLQEIVREDWPLEAVSGLAAHLRSLASTVSGVPVWTAGPGSDAAHFGCAHGSAGIAMALACWARTCGDCTLDDIACETFRSLACHGRTRTGRALRVGPGDVRHHAVGNWCHGVAGFLWAILNGPGDVPGLRDEIDWAVDVLADAMSAGTPTYCHGLAGQLELWHMLEAVPRFNALAQARAGKVARALRAMHLKVDGRCVWPSDDPDVVTPDLWIGFLGPASALAMHAAGVRQPMLSAAWLARCASQAPGLAPPGARGMAGSNPMEPCS